MNDKSTDLAQGRLIEMGEIVTVDLDGKSKTKYPMALVIRFDSVEAIRKAINDGTCSFTFGDE